MTRQDYMSGKVSHEEYYTSVAQAAGVSFAQSPLLPQIKRALAAGDEHLNSISLQTWDLLAAVAAPALRQALKAHGDNYSLAGAVCTMKQAAKNDAK